MTNGKVLVNTLAGQIEVDRPEAPPLHHGPDTSPRRRVSFLDWLNGKPVDRQIAELELRVKVLEDELVAERTVNEFQGLAIEQMRCLLRGQTALAKGFASGAGAPE